MQRYQWHIFFILIGVVFIVLMVYAIPLRRLYTSAETRQTAEHLLIKSAEQYGLPKSDFFFTAIGERDYRLCRREHGRGWDPVTCDWHSVFYVPE